MSRVPRAGIGGRGNGDLQAVQWDVRRAAWMMMVCARHPPRAPNSASTGDGPRSKPPISGPLSVRNWWPRIWMRRTPLRPSVRTFASTRFGAGLLCATRSRAAVTAAFLSTRYSRSPLNVFSSRSCFALAAGRNAGVPGPANRASSKPRHEGMFCVSPCSVFLYGLRRDSLLRGAIAGGGG
jgi:hypothetical protein